MIDIAWGELCTWAIIVATVARMAIGFLWYTPALFGNVWMELAGLKKEDAQNGATTAMIGSVILSLLINIILAVIIQLTGAGDAVEGLWIGLIVALIVISSIGVNMLFELKKLKMFLITAGYHLVSILLASFIIGVWQ